MKHWNLWVARKEKNESQSDLGKLLGISAGRYMLKEQKKASFTLDEAVKLARHFDMSVDELFSEDVKVH